MTPAQPTFLLTIDVEDWFQVENLRPFFPPSNWDCQELRVEQNTHKILDLLDSIELTKLNRFQPIRPKQNWQFFMNHPEQISSGAHRRNWHDTKVPVNAGVHYREDLQGPIISPEQTNQINLRATFFVLGWIAERCPNLVREIQSRGHEVASHGYSHLMCNQMNFNELKQDLMNSKKMLENITGVEIRGYRAPNFSINDEILKLIEDCGYFYDASYNSSKKQCRCGTNSIGSNKSSEPFVYIDNNFVELKISNLIFGNQIIPFGGGGYFRLVPPSIFNTGIKYHLKSHHTYMFYLHPWEIDSLQPKLKSKGFATWRHYLNLDKTHKRLNGLLRTFSYCSFPTCSQYLNSYSCLSQI